MKWIIRKLENGQFESAYWQRPAGSPKEAVEKAAANSQLGPGLYLAVPERPQHGVFDPWPVFQVTLSGPFVDVAAFGEDS